MAPYGLETYQPSQRPDKWIIFALAVLAVLLALMMARADVVDLNIIVQIESSGNPLAYNRHSGATGLYQITPIAWKDVQNHFPELSKYPFICAYKPQVARLFAERLITINKGYLRHYGLDLSLANQLACYNQGIGLTRKRVLSKESKNYIKKYLKLTRAK